MTETTIVETAREDGMSDEEVVERGLAGETSLFEIVMRGYNHRLKVAVAAPR